MTKEEIIELAREAGFGTAIYISGDEQPTVEVWGGPIEKYKVQRLANLVAAKERERCALQCETLGDEYADVNAADCAEAIRSLK